MEVLSKDKIEIYIVPFLSKGNRGPSVRVELWRLISAILYRLKTGCQWRYLPVSIFFDEASPLSWRSVYYHFREWVKDGSFVHAWQELLRSHACLLDMSSVQFDGSQSLCKRGGEQVGYQKRKKGNSTNALFLCDNNGMPLAMGAPQSGNHHDLYEIAEVFKPMCDILEQAGINMDGLFLNADSGFDSAGMQKVCEEKGIIANIDQNARRSNEPTLQYRYFDELLYKRRFVIERMNAWIDSFKVLLVRFETRADTWKVLHYIAFIAILIRKL